MCSSAAFCTLRWARRGSVLSTRPDHELLEAVNTALCAARARRAGAYLSAPPISQSRRRRRLAAHIL